MRGGNNKDSGTSKVSSKNQQNNNNNNSEGTILLPKSAKDVNSAQDTIYLCNFRVSVDGEWLCLKELQDGMQNQANEGAPTDDPKRIRAANNKCNEKIVERDWVNYYCRCFLDSSIFPPSFIISSSVLLCFHPHHETLTYDLVARPH